MKTDRQQLEALRVSIAHLAASMGVNNPLVSGNAADWERNARNKDEGWNTLVLEMMDKFHEVQEPLLYKMEYDTTG